MRFKLNITKDEAVSKLEVLNRYEYSSVQLISKTSIDLNREGGFFRISITLDEGKIGSRFPFTPERRKLLVDMLHAIRD